MSLFVSLYAAILFFVLTPGILLTLPKGGKKFQVAGVHALVFAVVFHFTHKLVWRFGVSLEGMTDPPTSYYTDEDCKTVSSIKMRQNGLYEQINEKCTLINDEN